MNNKTLQVFNIQHYSLHDGSGIRTTVFLLGCPLRCLWCCNPESQEKQSLNLPLASKEMTVSQILAEVEKDEVFYKYGKGGLTISGGEPLSHKRVLVELVKEAYSRYIGIDMETSGYGDSDILLQVAKYLDHIYYDIKCLDSDMHKQWTGKDNDLILQNIVALRKAYVNLPITIRTPVIPGFNDSVDELMKIKKLADELNANYELLKYHRFGVGKYDKLGRVYPMPEGDLSEDRFQKIKKKVLNTDGMDI